MQLWKLTTLMGSAPILIALNVSQRYRIYSTPFLLLFALLYFHHVNDFPSWLGLRGLWGLLITIYIMHITAVLYIDKMILVPVSDLDEEYSIAALNYDPRSASWNFKTTYKVWNNPRRLPSPSTNDNSTFFLDDIKRPLCKTNAKSLTLTSFILLRTLKLCANALTCHLVATYIFLGAFRPITINDFSPHRERFFSRLIVTPTTTAIAPGVESINLREIILRAIISVHWLIAAYLLIQGWHHVLALLFVHVIRLDQAEDWPLLFGNLSQITSVRRFWGSFWHRLVARPYGSHAEVLSRKLFGLEAHSYADKVFVAFCIFLFLGLAHEVVAGSWGCGAVSGETSFGSLRMSWREL